MFEAFGAGSMMTVRHCIKGQAIELLLDAQKAAKIEKENPSVRGPDSARREAHLRPLGKFVGSPSSSAVRIPFRPTRTNA